MGYRKQIVRSATSVGASYRVACRSKSAADFIYKLKIVEEEADKPSLVEFDPADLDHLDDFILKRIY